MITSSGCICDVCGNYILGLTEKDKIYPFKNAGIENELHACYDCKILVEKLTAEKRSWEELPKGNLRKVFEDFYANKENNNG